MPEYNLEEPGAERRMRVLTGGEPTPEPAYPGPTWEQQMVVELRAEIDTYFVGLRQLNQMEPDLVFATLSAYSARLSEIRCHLVRSSSRRLQALRTKEVDPLLDEVDRQFRTHSRIVALRSLDWEMAKGQP